MNLYDINAAILGCIDAETGEVDAERLEILAMERDSKIENIGLWIKELNAEATAIRAEEMNLKKRREAAEKKAESLKLYLTSALEGEKFKTPRLSVSYRTAKAVSITDESAIPERFFKVERTLCRADISAAIKSGEAVSGAELIERTSTIIK